MWSVGHSADVLRWKYKSRNQDGEWSQYGVPHSSLTFTIFGTDTRSTIINWHYTVKRRYTDDYGTPSPRAKNTFFGSMKSFNEAQGQRLDADKDFLADSVVADLVVGKRTPVLQGESFISAINDEGCGSCWDWIVAVRHLILVLFQLGFQNHRCTGTNKFSSKTEVSRVTLWYHDGRKGYPRWDTRCRAQ